MKRLFGWLCLLTGIAVAAPSAADDDKGARKSDAKGTKEAAVSDEDFVAKALSGGMLEVESGRSAQGQTRTEQVKSFARKMVEDHTKSNQELATLAARKNIRIPKGMSEKHFEVIKRLARLTDRPFDAEFAKAQVESHEEAVSLFESASKGVKDQDLKAFAEKTLPTLRDHLKMARELRDKAKGGKDPGPKDGDHKRD